MNANKETVNYLTFDQAVELVNRISDRAENFEYYMSENEMYAMAELLSNIGVYTSDLVDVSRLADNYAINAEIVRPEEAEHYTNLEDSLFKWEEDGKTVYCYQW